MRLELYLTHRSYMPTRLLLGLYTFQVQFHVLLVEIRNQKSRDGWVSFEVIIQIHLCFKYCMVHIEMCGTYFDHRRSVARWNWGIDFALKFGRWFDGWSTQASFQPTIRSFVSCNSQNFCGNYGPLLNYAFRHGHSVVSVKCDQLNQVRFKLRVFWMRCAFCINTFSIAVKLTRTLFVLQ